MGGAGIGVRVGDGKAERNGKERKSGHGYIDYPLLFLVFERKTNLLVSLFPFLFPISPTPIPSSSIQESKEKKN